MDKLGFAASSKYPSQLDGLLLNWKKSCFASKQNKEKNSEQKRKSWLLAWRKYVQQILLAENSDFSGFGGTFDMVFLLFHLVN